MLTDKVIPELAKVMCQVASIVDFYDKEGEGLDLYEITSFMRVKGWNSDKKYLLEVLKNGEELGVFDRISMFDQATHTLKARYLLSEFVSDRRSKSLRSRNLTRVDSIEINKARITKKRLRRQKAQENKNLQHKDKQENETKPLQKSKRRVQKKDVSSKYKRSKLTHRLQRRRTSRNKKME